jgi:hypothetical protein
MKKYDLHIHTHYSACSNLSPENILKQAKKKGLNGIAITDHNSIKGALKTKQLNKNKNFQVIVGEEIKTDKGELLAYFVQEKINKQDIYETIDAARSQDCILAVAHPFRLAYWQNFKLPLKELEGKADAVEIINSRNILFGNNRAIKKTAGLDFAKLGSSDAHISLDIGKACTVFQGDLRDAIKKRETNAIGTTTFGIISDIAASINKRVLTPLGVKKRWT